MDATAHDSDPVAPVETLPALQADNAPRSSEHGARSALLGRAGRILAILGVLGLALITLVWSREPATFDVTSQAIAETGREPASMAPGSYTTAALLGVSRTLLGKSGGYLRNDVMPPSVLLDNMPAWERGVVVEVRDSVRALRNDFSRAQTQSPEDGDLVEADAQFHFDDAHWILPATEDEFEAGIASLARYLERLHSRGAERARFYVRADNLNFFLATVEKRLGSYSQQLAGNVLDWRALVGENEVLSGQGLTPTSWLEVDDVFFEARGYIWALLHTLRGIEQDFGAVLEAKAARLPLREIIGKLEQTQATVWSPVILNNSGYGLLTNHSLVMASYISRANAAIIDLRLLLAEG